MSKLITCVLCNKKKQLIEFYLRKTGTVGEYKCKYCLLNKRHRKYYMEYEKVRECNRKAVSKYQKNNPDKLCEKTARYRTKKKSACPVWISDRDISKIKAIYKMCRSVSKKTGIPHQVDHIVPITSRLVCGLHVPWNLRIITKEENLKKGNTLIEEIVCS